MKPREKHTLSDFRLNLCLKLKESLMPNPASGSVRIASQCHFERYEEGKIPSIFQMHDKVEVNDIPNMQSGITSQYEINKLTVNGHEIKVGQYLIRVGSALFVVDDPELCGIAAPSWDDGSVQDGDWWPGRNPNPRNERIQANHALDAARYAIENPSPVFRNSHRGASVDRIIIDDQVPTRDDAMYDSMVAAMRGSSFSREEVSELGARIQADMRRATQPIMNPANRNELNPEGPVITRSDMQRMVEEWRRQ